MKREVMLGHQQIFAICDFVCIPPTDKGRQQVPSDGLWRLIKLRLLDEVCHVA